MKDSPDKESGYVGQSRSLNKVGVSVQKSNELFSVSYLLVCLTSINCTNLTFCFHPVQFVYSSRCCLIRCPFSSAIFQRFMPPPFVYTSNETGSRFFSVL